MNKIKKCKKNHPELTEIMVSVFSLSWESCTTKLQSILLLKKIINVPWTNKRDNVRNYIFNKSYSKAV